jgi:DNA-binding MarR family transcriptional regulator
MVKDLDSFCRVGHLRAIRWKSEALRRLERRGHVVAEWGVSENNGRARYYALTATGRRQLQREAAAWRSYAQAVFNVLEPLPGGGMT